MHALSLHNAIGIHKMILFQIVLYTILCYLSLFLVIGKPEDSLLQQLALSSTSLRNEAYMVARLLGLSKDDVTECEGEARFAVNKAVRFTEGILFKWKRKCPKDGCTTLALFQVLAFLDIHLQDVNGVIWQPNCTSV